MKKNLVMVCLLVLLTSLCFAQGNKEASSTNDEVLLRLWMGIPAENGPQDVVDAFNREYKDKGIQVEYERYVNNDQGNLKLETNLLAGSGIDVYASY
ncbi:MAG: hypothetical protein PHR69_06740, partial [Sphaerochaeta sp.]|nr:hypothetical protein [Sphaerochaeta sp.]